MTGWGPKVLDGGGGGQPSIPGDGPLPDPSKSTFNRITAVPANVETDLLVFPVPATPIIHLVRIDFGGENIGNYKLYEGATQQAEYFTWFNGPGLTATWDFTDTKGGGVALTPSSILKVTVEHWRPFLGPFFARMQYREIL